MWLLPSSACSSCIRSSDKAVLMVAHCLPTPAHFWGQQRPFAQCFAAAEGVQRKGRSVSFGKPLLQKVTRLRVNAQNPQCPLAPVVSDLLLSDLAWKPCVCSSSCKTSNQTRSRMVRVCDIVYQSIISIFCFLSLLQSSSVIHKAKQEVWEGMKMVGLGCTGEPKQGHPQKRDQ